MKETLNSAFKTLVKCYKDECEEWRKQRPGCALPTVEEWLTSRFAMWKAKQRDQTGRDFVIGEQHIGGAVMQGTPQPMR